MQRDRSVRQPGLFAIGHRLRQHHLGVLAWCDQTDPQANPVAGLEHAIDALGRAVGASSTSLVLLGQVVLQQT